MKANPSLATVRAAVCLASLIAVAASCADTSGPGKAPANGLPLLIVSSPVRGATSAFASVVGPPAYVSLPPASVPDGITATISDQATGFSTTIALVDGGFDPVAVTANVGDTVYVVITRSGSAGPASGYQVVSASRVPTIVRTSPPRGKRDVPINAAIVVVFSAPMDSSTLNTGAIQLQRQLGFLPSGPFTPVAGTVRLSDATGVRAEFHADLLLAKRTDYRLVITGAPRDLNGLALESGDTVAFATGSADPAQDLVFTTVSVGAFHTCGLVLSGAAYCWGENSGGALGDGTLASSATPVAVAGGLTFAAVSAGFAYACGVTTVGALYCWGGSGASAWVGVLGSSPVPYAPGLTFKAVSAGNSHVCAITTAGAAYCWGFDESGELGLQVGGVAVGPGGAVAGGLSFVSIAAGGYFTCGVTTTGAAYCWGDNGFGQLGTGSTTGPDQCLHGDILPGPGFYSPCSSVPLAVAGGLTFVQVQVQGASACGLTPSGAAYCWGDNQLGQLGNGTTTGPDTCFFSRPCTASPVAVAGGQTFTALSSRGLDACGITSTGAAYCWGFGDDGQLGDGKSASSAVPVAVAGGLSFATVSTGANDGGETCGVTTRGVAYCWGANWYGSLGNGTSGNSAVPVKVAGQP